MSIYEKTKCARALLYWAANNNGNEAYYLEDRMYAVADNGMVVILTADSYDEAIRKAKARPQGEWVVDGTMYRGGKVSSITYRCSLCGRRITWINIESGKTNEEFLQEYPFCHCGADMRKESDNERIQ